MSWAKNSKGRTPGSIRDCSNKGNNDNESSDSVNDNESPDSVKYKVETQKGSNDIRPNAPSLVQITATTQLTIISWAKDSKGRTP